MRSIATSENESQSRLFWPTLYMQDDDNDCGGRVVRV